MEKENISDGSRGKMYLISLYFDDKTNTRLQQHINQVAKKTKNTYMLDGNVPPHITISAFQTGKEEQAVEILERVAGKLESGSVQWVSVGAFLPYVIYLAPVLDEYLHMISVQISFEVLQGQFGILKGQVTKIGLAKTNPYENVTVFKLTIKEKN